MSLVFFFFGCFFICQEMALCQVIDQVCGNYFVFIRWFSLIQTQQIMDLVKQLIFKG